MIRVMTEADIPEICELDKKAFSDPWDSTSFEDEIAKDYAYYFVYEAGDKLTGYAGIWCIYETAELIRIAVLPEYQGMGIGKTLMTELSKSAKNSGCERMMLEVRRSNERAKKMYEKEGFKEISVRKGYYNGEDAIIMERVYK